MQIPADVLLHLERDGVVVVLRCVVRARHLQPPRDDLRVDRGEAGESVHGTGVFATTHWSVVLEAQGESPAAQEALEKLCRTYWRPIFAFLRRQGIGPTERSEERRVGKEC